MTANGQDSGISGGSLALSIILSLGFGACVATGLTYRFMSKRMGGGRRHRGGMRMGMTTEAFNTPISVELSRNGEGLAGRPCRRRLRCGRVCGAIDVSDEREERGGVCDQSRRISVR